MRECGIMIQPAGHRDPASAELADALVRLGASADPSDLGDVGDPLQDLSRGRRPSLGDSPSNRDDPGARTLSYRRFAAHVDLGDPVHHKLNAGFGRYSSGELRLAT